MCTCTPLRIEERILGRLSEVVVRWCRWMFPFDELLPNSVQSSDAARVRRVTPPISRNERSADDNRLSDSHLPSRTRWTPLRPFSAPSPQSSSHVIKPWRHEEGLGADRLDGLRSRHAAAVDQGLHECPPCAVGFVKHLHLRADGGTQTYSESHLDANG